LYDRQIDIIFKVRYIRKYNFKFITPDCSLRGEFKVDESKCYRIFYKLDKNKALNNHWSFDTTVGYARHKRGGLMKCGVLKFYIIIV
jgi:hypothetical protein